MKQGRTMAGPAQDDSAGLRIGNIWLRVAAVLVVAIPITATLFLIYISPWLFAEPWLDQARRGHGEWIETERISGGQILDVRNYLTGLRRLGAVPHMPDLTSAGLHLGRVSYVPPGRDRAAAIHAGYRGERRCRVSLWITPTGEPGTGPLVRHRGEISFSWYTDGLRYIHVTSEMQKKRFHFIADVARESTIERRAPGESTGYALGLSARIAPPCKN